MASEPILAVEANIDDQIVEFCKGRPGLTEEQVVRDIARIAQTAVDGVDVEWAGRWDFRPKRCTKNTQIM